MKILNKILFHIFEDNDAEYPLYFLLYLWNILVITGYELEE
jgi:hypothetical protein